MTIPIPTPGDFCQWESSSEDDVAKGQVNWMLDLVHLTPLVHSWDKR